MTQRPQAFDPRTRLALGCSALARAGQQLSAATTPEQARAALVQVAGQLEADRNLAQLIPLAELSQKCREEARGTETSALLTACRQMATSLARRASSLAAEVQQKAAAAPTAAGESPVSTPPAPAAVESPTPAQRAVPEAPEVPKVPSPPGPPSALPEAVTTGKEPAPLPAKKADSIVEVPARLKVDPDQLRRLTIVTGPAERQAVEAALEVGKRFARVQGVAVVDTETNRMWQAQLSNGMPHAPAAESVRVLETGGYRDWRLPSAEELQALLAQNGLQGLRDLGVLPAMSAPFLWTSAVRSRFFGFKKEAAVFHSGTGEMVYRPLRDSAVRVLAVRGQ